ncbi:MAG: hypothetical protein M3Y50_09615 [Acidobacteriota bacterium]|nr:hypothetical protein [Acidobacteriota bacterium]
MCERYFTAQVDAFGQFKVLAETAGQADSAGTAQAFPKQQRENAKKRRRRDLLFAGVLLVGIPV